MDIQPIESRKAKNLHGFTLIKEEIIPEIGGIARFLQHNATGAELVSVLNDDENKCFSVNFRTPPHDSTGVAHILEHSVLCGSRKYPVREPFVELLKSSLQTFLNALTFPDKTCYPVASANLQDFYNLVDVYIDAVFAPRILDDNGTPFAEGRHILRQEGWHIEPGTAENENDWSFQGVVYNEMKGVYSSPDSLLMEESQHALFPHTLYALDSGGKPEDIINLTYEDFKAFHQKFYHPSNARFFFWGDDGEEARLEKLATYLQGYEKIYVDSAIEAQKHLYLPRKIETSYAAENVEDSDDANTPDDNAENAPNGESNTPKAHVTVSWLLCESDQTEERMVLEMLEHILMGMPGSPLRKALMDSGLGEDITGAGLETDLLQAYFSTGLRSINPDDADFVEVLILETLSALAETGIDPHAIEAAINSLEFDLRENNTGRFPRGLDALFASLTTWLYDKDPFAPLKWEAPLASIKSRVANGEKVFENAIQKWLIDNTHRCLVVLLPDPTLAEKNEQEEAARLAAMRLDMSPEEEKLTREIALSLHANQAKPDTPEALATIPCLSPTDMPLQNHVLPSAEQPPHFLLHELNTSGILYVRLLFSLENIPPHLLPLTGLFCRALTEMGTKQHSFVELGLELAMHTGGVGASTLFQNPFPLSEGGPQYPLASLILTGKSTKDQITRLTALMQEILLDACFDNRERFLQMALEEKARIEQSLIPAGHSFVSLYLGAGLSAAGVLDEHTSGLTYLNAMRALNTRLENDWEGVRHDLQTLAGLIFPHLFLCDLTGEASFLPEAQAAIASLVHALEEKLPQTAKAAPLLSIPLLSPVSTAFITPAQVNYMGLATNLHQAGYTSHGSAVVILKHLRMAYLWEKVRVHGGAYGVYANYSRVSGSLIFLSYRDPQVAATLDAFRAAPDYLANAPLTQEDINRAIVGAIGDMDTYLLPSAKGSTALNRYLVRDTPQKRQQLREEILSTSLQHFRDFAPILANALTNAIPAGLGGSTLASYAQQQSWDVKKIL